MDSPFSPTVDEVHCLRPMCTHTCCWESEQRIREGRPRQVKAPPPASAAASEEDRLPIITVVNASEWPDPVEVLPLKSEDNFSEAATNTLISQVVSPKEPRRQENVQIPRFNSAVPTHLDTHRENKTVQLWTVHISPFPRNTSTAQSSKPILMWVPSSCYVPPHGSQHSAKSPRLAVKKLFFLPSVEMTKSAEHKKRLKKDKSRKRALLKSQLNQEGKDSLKPETGNDLSDPGLSWLGPDSGLQVKKASAPPQVHRFVPEGQTVAAAPEAKDEQQPPRSAQNLHLRNRLRALLPVRERIQRRHTQEKHHPSKHKLDLKTGVDGIDWESLKRQTSLWRKPAQPVGPECQRPSPSEGKADYVPCCLHPVPILSSHRQSKSSSTTGDCKLRAPTPFLNPDPNSRCEQAHKYA